MSNAFDRVLEGITAVVKWVMIVMTCVIFFITTFTVFTRYIINYVPSWSRGDSPISSRLDHVSGGRTGDQV